VAVQPTDGLILVLDDDPAVRQMLSVVLSSAGFEVICCADALTLLTEVRRRTPGCILLDQVLRETCGVVVLNQLRRAGCTAPVLMISGVADITTAVRALKAGATDFLEKPFRGPDLIARVKATIDDAKRSTGGPDRPSVAIRRTGQAPLTGRERDVLALLANGSSTKETALQLGLSPRTVESHRLSIMRKFGVKKLVDLVRFVTSAPDFPGSE
jgi:FixJ family two-component response regulator